MYKSDLLELLEKGKIVSAKHNKVDNCLEYIFKLHDKEYPITFGNANEVIYKKTRIRSRSFLNELIFIVKAFDNVRELEMSYKERMNEAKKGGN